MSQPTRRVLPPGVQDDIVFGIMWIKVGVYKPLKSTAITSHKVSIQFWGQSNAAELYTSQNNIQTQQYEVKCPVTFFQKYLRDMKHNFKIEVDNIGNVYLDLTKYLKNNLEITSKVAFEHFKSFFEVIGKNNKKVGTLELELCSNFNPAIAIRQLGQEINQNASPVCLAETMKSCKCSGQCKCKIDKITALDVLAVQKPELFKQFYEECKQRVSPKAIFPNYTPSADLRIPNSLNLQPNKSPFDPKKYVELPQKDKQSLGQGAISKKKVSQQIAKDGTVSPKRGSKFPSVQKILTYSNLRLKKQLSQQTQNKLDEIKVKKIESIKNPSSKDNNQTNIPSKINEEIVSHKQSPLEVDFLNVENTNNKYKKEQERKQPQLLAPAFQKQKTSFEPQKIKVDVSISRVSEVKQVDDSVSVEIQRDILSRVVHLNQQLQKQQKAASPKKNPLNELLQPHYPQSNFKNPHFNFNQPIVSRKKGSSMLLNMIFEINTNSVDLNKAGKFYISYRPYGQKEHLKVGPQFEQTITLMFPVGQPQIKKMNKIPFILQFWSPVNNELLGITKIDLTKIEKGFILEGTLNQVAIKTSLLPTVIHKGNISINNLLDQPVGQCYLQAHIGTTSQIQSYLNSPKSHHYLKLIENNKPQKQIIQQNIEKKQVTQKKIRSEGSILDLTNLLQLIEANPIPNTLQPLLSFMNLKQTSSLQLQNLLDKIGFKGGNPFRLLGQNDRVECKQLAVCHNDYKRVRQIINQVIKKQLQTLPESIISNLLKYIKSHSNFGIIAKKELKVQLQSINPLIYQCLPQFIQEDNLLEWTMSRGKKFLKQITFNSIKQLFSIISQVFLQQSSRIDLKIQELISSNQGVTVIALQKLIASVLKDNGHTFSRWSWIVLLHNIYQSFNEDFKNYTQINIILVYNWFVQKIKQKQRENQKNNQIEEKKQDYKQTIKNKQQQIVGAKDYEKEKMQQSIAQRQQTNTKQNRNRQVEAQLEKIQDQKQSQNSRPIEKNSYFQHKFVVTLQQLYTSGQQIGECQVSYKFPFEQHLITSKKIQLIRDKCRYRLISQGIHKFTVKQPIQLYFGQNTLSIRVSINGHSYLYADVHPDQLTSPGSSSKVIPIFSTEKEGMAGKLKLKIVYSKKQSQVAVVSRQTTQDVFLPKNGYINYEIITIVEQVKIKQMFNLKQDTFYLQIILDLFGESKPLAPHYPPVHSNLSSDFSSPLIITGSYKLSLNPQVLQHLRGANWVARLLLVYYSKQRGNYQKKQVVIATVSAPLLSAIRQQGISGQYAFKNKLGMFVSLAQAKIKYQKTSKTHTLMSSAIKQYTKQNIWIVLDFAQMINFEGDLNWIKFEIINQGKRFTTQKTTIRDCGFFNLQKRCLMLHLSYQDFYSMKIVPIKIITPHQQFGIDLNLRHIAKNIGKQKYSIDSHYFIVLDDKTQPVKIRVGLKIYVFRGPTEISGYVQALTNNTIRSVVDIVQKEDDYNTLIQGLKQQLKLSHKSIDQFLNLILDRRRKDRLPRSFFTCLIQPALDTSPILCTSSGDVQALGQQLRSQVLMEDLFDYLEQMGIVLQNLRRQLLQRYKFCKLNENKIDQNVQYLGLHDEIDLLVLLKKIQIQDKSSNEGKYKHLRLSIIKGLNFHLLYNGIKPNCLVKIPEFGLETEVMERTSEPIFNQHINIDVSSQTKMKSIKIQAYHVPSDHLEQIMIGQGILTITQTLKRRDIPNSKVYRAVINSLMSNRQQASLDIKVQVVGARDQSHMADQQQQQIENDESIGDSVIEDAVDRIKKFKGLQKKAMLFQSSDQD